MNDTETPLDTPAKDLRAGMVVDTADVASTFDPHYEKPGHDMWQYEFATVFDDSAPAEPVDGTESVLIFTDQGNFKVPADFSIIRLPHLEGGK